MLWLLLLLMACAVAGFTCCRLSLATVRAAAIDKAAGRGHRLTVYEAAFLSGGPYRVADVALVSMARQRRLLLAHTGWATVVDPRGRDDLERSVLGAIGPAGQSRIAPIRAATAAAEPVRALSARLVADGLAVPESARSTIAGAVRQVRGALVAVLVFGAVALLTPGQGQGAPGGSGQFLAWFALPLTLTVSCLLIARVEVHPYTRWASPSGQRLLGGLSTGADGDDRSQGDGDDRTYGDGDDRTYLTAVAVGGVAAARDPGLLSAFTQRGH
ncbi:TIGR04222 domain-containing membrane protein [Streptomyces sp. NPDC058001]|uniref:TIGR04222 domain-containing membrane protein n=1 Tax=Streptomyces sp. NPDC058001 TaxID=3346300 RepID=UPI0036F0C5AC